MRRVFFIIVALAIGVPTATVGLNAPAGASSGVATCKVATTSDGGNTVQFSRCNNKKRTGGSGTAVRSGSSYIVTWANGATATLSYSSSTAESDTEVVKKSCGASVEVELTGSVTASTSLAVGGTFGAEFCQVFDAEFTLEPHTKAVF